MGSLLTAHVLREPADFARLVGLPNSVGFRAYRHPSMNIYMVDTFRGPGVPKYPFQNGFPAADIALNLPPGLELLEEFYTYLSRIRETNAFSKSCINATILMSKLLQTSIFSFVSNDDGIDFTCSATDGDLVRLKCLCADFLAEYENKALLLKPLVPEFEEDEESLTDCDSLQRALPNAKVFPRDTPWDAQIYAVAIAELAIFAGLEGDFLNLGSDEPFDDASEWELVASQ